VKIRGAVRAPFSGFSSFIIFPRLKLEGASIAFDIYTVRRLQIFPPCYALQMDFLGPGFRIDERSEKFVLIR
jgi:hypothetical protein